MVRGGKATPENLQAGTDQHASVPGLLGFSVQYAPGRSIRELVGFIPHRFISVTTRERLISAAATAGYTIRIVQSPGRGYHATVVTPYPLPEELARALSTVFDRMPNPASDT